MAHPTDVYVGKKIRQFRWLTGATQTDLADSLGIRFQQVQKYETGANRISASRLLDAATFLKQPVSAFFPAPDNDNEETDFSAAECRAIANMRKMTGPQRVTVLNMVDAIVGGKNHD